jgi:hypothetical protein
MEFIAKKPSRSSMKQISENLDRKFSQTEQVFVAQRAYEQFAVVVCEHLA